MSTERVYGLLDRLDEKDRPGLLAIREEVLKAHPKWSVDKAHYEAKIIWTGRNPEAKL